MLLAELGYCHRVRLIRAREAEVMIGAVGRWRCLQRAVRADGFFGVGKSSARPGAGASLPLHLRRGALHQRDAIQI
jgi:hypothetical protein